ncbi:molybdopterin-guanine dinucleotide biosynthesis protein MobC [Actinorhabdospora filicis]|uniref:Molybdopterin-guanine dinucleotide biosynthesis protein MobC n=1 Tax=Actinorhabdospora filicis TaxID=1785913 RepID=A0A9W6WC15_9ACTN|nr:GNAT family N-acetyltransferase [Actinorhabdospora filicis]GLZ80136.1 molybdopterin-guanine dinucleotide biosynthesis protein MobC [Actinorhabdospora filicis]
MQIHRGVPPGTIPQVADLYWSAFARKLGPALGPPHLGRRFIAEHLDPDRAVVALDRDRVLGVAGYQLAGRALVGGGARDVLATYGLARGLVRLPLLLLLLRNAKKGELVMDGIAVAPAARGTGIGTLLLDEVAAIAAESGHDRVRLDVIDVNPRARALYERRGFAATRTTRTPYLRWLMGFAAVTTMHRRVGAA